MWWYFWPQSLHCRSRGGSPFEQARHIPAGLGERTGIRSFAEAWTSTSVWDAQKTFEGWTGGGTKGGWKIVRYAHTWMIGWARGQRLEGRVWVIRKFLIRSIARSTCIRKLAMRLVLTSSSSSNCCRPPRNGGMLTRVPSGIMVSRSNPRSAIMESPGCMRSNSLLRFVSSLSEILPPQRSDKKEITPFGVTPTSSFRVFVFL